MKGIQITKEEVKLSLLADDMILYIKKPKVPPRIGSDKLIWQSSKIQN